MTYQFDILFKNGKQVKIIDKVSESILSIMKDVLYNKFRIGAAGILVLNENYIQIADISKIKLKRLK